MRTYIAWNEKGYRLLPPMERKRFEHGGPFRRFPGACCIDADGCTWYVNGEARLCVGLASKPQRETLAERMAPAIAIAQGSER